MTFPIKSYAPRHEKKWKRHPDGTIEAEIYAGDDLIVEVFTYPGGTHGEAFTTLRTYLAGRVFSARLDKSYSERWLRRLAWDFVYQCQKQAEGATP